MSEFGEVRREPLLNATLRWFLAAMILANIGSEMYYALLPVYIAQLGAGVAQVGLVFSVAAVVPLVLQILGGWLSDTIGRLRAIAIGSVAASLGYILMPLAPAWSWVIPALALEYVAGSLVGPSFSAFIAEQSAESVRGRVFGITKGIFLSVAVIGPLLGGFLAQRCGFRAMLAVAATLYVVAAVMRVWMATAARFGAGSTSERPTLRSLRSSLSGMLAMLAAGGLITWVLVTDGVIDISWALSGDLEPLYISQIGGLSAGAIGVLQAVRGAAMIPATLLAGWLTDRLGERRIIAAGFVLIGAARLIFVQAGGQAGFALSQAVMGLGFGAVIPAYDSLISKAVPEKMRGIAFGVFGTSIGLLSLPAPWLGGQLWERISPQLPFLLTALAAFACILPVWTKFRLRTAEVATPAAGVGLEEKAVAG